MAAKTKASLEIIGSDISKHLMYVKKSNKTLQVRGRDVRVVFGVIPK
jgi:hypothetical protein